MILAVVNQVLLRNNLESDFASLLSGLRRFIMTDGPEPVEYSACDELFASLLKATLSQDSLALEIKELFRQCDCLRVSDSILGHSQLKPYGYPGDFDILERIYNWRVSEKHRKWDTYALSRPAAIAIRNRKTYFKNLIINRLKNGGSVLNLGCGSARDHFEFCTENPESRVVATCVDMDGNAIDFARNLNRDFQHRIHFVEENVFRFHTIQTYNLVWIGGLCDYLSDRAMVILLQSCRRWLKPDGELVVGNFNADHNPSRAFMELFGDWHIRHRSMDELIELTSKAGYSRDKIMVDKEPEGINLFLHIRL